MEESGFCGFPELGRRPRIKSRERSRKSLGECSCVARWSEYEIGYEHVPSHLFPASECDVANVPRRNRDDIELWRRARDSRTESSVTAYAKLEDIIRSLPGYEAAAKKARPARSRSAARA